MIKKIGYVELHEGINVLISDHDLTAFIEENCPIGNYTTLTSIRGISVAREKYRAIYHNTDMLDECPQTMKIFAACALDDEPILIEDIEYKVSVEWQPSLINKLETVFPEKQIIITTNNVTMLPKVANENIIHLFSHSASNSGMTYGHDVGDILKYTYEVDAEPWRAYDYWTQFELHLDDGNIEQAEGWLKDLEAMLGKDYSKIIEARVNLDLAKAERT